jgi:S1-C subfamily serine protease
VKPQGPADMTINQSDSLGDKGKESSKEGVDSATTSEDQNPQPSTELSEKSPVIKMESEEEISDQYKKVFRQGPWLHPYPTIVTLSIIGLIFSLVFGSFIVDRYYIKFFTPNFFSAPPDLESTIKRVQQSTVVVTCGQSQGTGWAVDLGPVVADADFQLKVKDNLYPYSVITNHHVIEACENNPDGVRVSNGATSYISSLFAIDKRNDLAIVATQARIPELEISPRPEPGWWSMALGSPFGLEKSVSTGNIMNVTADGYVISTAPVNPGNSGGPLVNSLGQVMGTNTAYLRGYQSVNIASDVDLLCRELVDCGEDLFKRDYVEECDTWCQFKSWTSELFDFIFG